MKFDEVKEEKVRHAVQVILRMCLLCVDRGLTFHIRYSIRLSLVKCQQPFLTEEKVEF